MARPYDNPLKRPAPAPAPPPAPAAPRARPKAEPKLATRPVRVRLSPRAEPMTVEMPTVESRFALAFREPTTDNPGLVLTDAGDVYLVEPDGTRLLLMSGGGSTWPTFMQLADPGPGSPGDTWVRPVPEGVHGAYPNQFGVGAFFWNPVADGSTGAWQQIAPVALDDSGNVLGIIDVDNDGVIVLESFKAANAGGSTVYVEPDRIFLLTQDTTVRISETSGVLIENSPGNSLGIFGPTGHDALQVKVEGAEWFVVGDDDASGILANITDGHNFHIHTPDHSGDVTIDDHGTLTVRAATGRSSLNVKYPDATEALQIGDDVSGIFFTLRDADVFRIGQVFSTNIVGGTVLTPKLGSSADALTAYWDDGAIFLTAGAATAGMQLSLLHDNDTFQILTNNGTPMRVLAGSGHDIVSLQAATVVAPPTVPASFADLVITQASDHGAGEAGIAIYSPAFQPPPDGWPGVYIGTSVGDGGYGIGVMNLYGVDNTNTVVANVLVQGDVGVAVSVPNGSDYPGLSVTPYDGIATNNGRWWWAVTQAGYEMLAGGLPGPADGDLHNGERFQWYDPTTGLPVLRFKEKDVAGTVTSGVTLSCSGHQSTVGSAGGASALPATPTEYLKVRDEAGNLFVIPAYAAA